MNKGRRKACICSAPTARYVLCAGVILGRGGRKARGWTKSAGIEDIGPAAARPLQTANPVRPLATEPYRKREPVPRQDTAHEHAEHGNGEMSRITLELSRLTASSQLARDNP